MGTAYTTFAWILVAAAVSAAATTRATGVGQVHTSFGDGEDFIVSWSTAQPTSESCVEFEFLQSSIHAGLEQRAYATQGLSAFSQRACGNWKLFTDGGEAGYTQVRHALYLFQVLSGQPQVRTPFTTSEPSAFGEFQSVI